MSDEKKGRLDDAGIEAITSMVERAERLRDAMGPGYTVAQAMRMMLVVTRFVQDEPSGADLSLLNMKTPGREPN